MCSHGGHPQLPEGPQMARQGLIESCGPTFIGVICLGLVDSKAQLQLYKQAIQSEGGTLGSLNRALEACIITHLLSVDFHNVPKYALGLSVQMLQLARKVGGI